MKPIPRKLLIHTAKAVVKSAPGMFGERETVSETPLEFIRVEPSSALKASKTNEQVQLSAVLFFDCRNSRPKGYDFSHAEKIVFQGEEYDIVNVDRLSDSRGLHHLEVGLCR